MYTNKYMIFHIGNFLTIYITINYKLQLFFTYILCCIPKFIRSELILIPGICFKWLRIPQNFHYNCDFAFAVFVVIKFHWCVHAFDNSNSNSNFFAAQEFPCKVTTGTCIIHTIYNVYNTAYQYFKKSTSTFYDIFVRSYKR